MYIYEATITKEDDGYIVQFDDISAAYAEGDSLQDALKAAAETLKLVLAEYIDTGMKLPEPVFKLSTDNKFRVAITVEVTREFIELTKCVSVTEAARELGVTKSRVCHMLDSGILQAIPFGNDRMVTISSINARRANPRGAGRPGSTGSHHTSKMLDPEHLQNLADELASLQTCTYDYSLGNIRTLKQALAEELRAEYEAET